MTGVSLSASRPANTAAGVSAFACKRKAARMRFSCLLKAKRNPLIQGLAPLFEPRHMMSCFRFGLSMTGLN
jgi:hypothetical protein